MFTSNEIKKGPTQLPTAGSESVDPVTTDVTGLEDHIRCTCPPEFHMTMTIRLFFARKGQNL